MSAGARRSSECIPAARYVRETAEKYGFEQDYIWNLLDDYLGYTKGVGYKMTLYERQYMDQVIEGRCEENDREAEEDDSYDL